MANDNPGTLVSTEWLAAHLENPDMRILDASWHMPDSGRNARAEYDRAHIPGARFFDIDRVSDPDSNLPHMAPPPERFISCVRAMGVGDGHQVVVYDSVGLFSAARVWWLFRLMGKSDVAVLDGGLPKWTAEKRATEDLPPMARARHVTVSRLNHLVKDATQVAAASKLSDHEILDARSPARFSGAEPEQRQGLRSGHIPGSKNVHYATLLNPDGTMKEPDALRSVFDAANVDLGRPVITTCGSGVTAAIVSLALEILGRRRHSLYDGSWSEWGMNGDLEIETGA